MAWFSRLSCALRVRWVAIHATPTVPTRGPATESASCCANVKPTVMETHPPSRESDLQTRLPLAPELAQAHIPFMCAPRAPRPFSGFSLRREKRSRPRLLELVELDVAERDVVPVARGVRPRLVRRVTAMRVARHERP